MSIQFSCPQCSQPIEIDDQWAMQPVACPYCRNTVKAPAHSSYIAPTEVPKARTIDTIASAQDAPPGVDAASRNVIAIWALGLSALWLISYLVGSTVIAMYMFEGVGEDATREEIMRNFNENVQAGNLPAEVLAGGLFVFLAVAFWVGGLICAILGMRVRRRRGFVLASFALLALGPILLVGSLAMQL